DLAVDNRVQHHHNGGIVVTLLLHWRVHSSNQSNRSSAATRAGRSRKQLKRFNGLQVARAAAPAAFGGYPPVGPTSSASFFPPRSPKRRPSQPKRAIFSPRVRPRKSRFALTALLFPP